MLVGRGTFSNVYELGDKQVQKVSVDAPMHQVFVREWMLLAGMDHPNIISLQGVNIVDKYPALILERMQHTLYRKRTSLSNSRVKSIMYQLLQALVYIHKRGLIHGDVKTANILLVPGVKLIDFGLACITPTSNEVIYTLNYRAPELLDDLEYDQRVDMWGLGCVFYEMLTGWSFIGEYYRTVTDCKAAIRRGLSAGVLSAEKIGHAAHDLLTSLLCHRESRISAKEALHHPYFADTPQMYIELSARPCIRARLPQAIVRLVDHYQVAYKFSNPIWGLAIHLLQQVYARKSAVIRRKAMVKAAIGLAAKYHGFAKFKEVSEEVDIFLLLEHSVCTRTVWDSVITDDDETVRLLKHIEHTKYSTKSIKKKLALCRSRDPVLYQE